MPNLTKLVLFGPRLALNAPRVATRVVLTSVGVVAGIPALVARLSAALTAIETAAARVTEVTETAAVVTERVETTRAAAMDVLDRITDMQTHLADLAASLGPFADRVAGIDPQLMADVTRMRDQLRPLVTDLTTLAPDTPAQVDDLVRQTGPLIGEVRSLVLPLLGELRQSFPRSILPVEDDDPPA